MLARSNTRLLILGVLLAALLAALGLRAVQLTLVRGPDLAGAAETARTRQLPDPAPRGLIVDMSGKPLVGNSPQAALAVDRQALAEQPDEGSAMLAEAATALGMTRSQVKQRLISCVEPDAPPRPICDDGSPAAAVVIASSSGNEQQLLGIAENPQRYPGLRVVATVRRSYPFTGVTAGHLLGHLGEASPDDVAAAAAKGHTLTSADRIGRSGLEQQYDADLRGVPGERRVVVDTSGQAVGEEQVELPVPGNNLVTSINVDLQQRVERELADALARTGSRKATGAAVVMSADTGRILAISSQPDYDPRDWVGGISTEDYRELSRAGALVDYSVQGQLPPGSIFKPITVAAMQRSGYSLTDSYDCPASYQAGGRKFTNFNSEAYGYISLRRAIEVSCNTVFYRAGDRLWRKGGGERAGSDEVDPIARAAKTFGLGKLTGIDLPGEATGSVASPAAKYGLWQERKDAWCAAAKQGYPKLRRTDPALARYYTALDRENCKSGQRWRQGDAINAAIGQGLTTVTPIQMAAAYAAIGNGGTLVVPAAARAVVDQQGELVRDIAPQDHGQVKVPKRTLKFLRSAMTGVPQSGTAAEAFSGFPLQRFPVAGKTGSAQIEGKQSTSWFASFAPAQNPQYVVVVMITEGGTGGENAAPAARGIYESLFGVGGKPVFPRSGPDQDIPKISGVRQ